MDKEIMSKVMDEVMKRLGQDGEQKSPEPAPAATSFSPAGCSVTEFVGTARGETIGLVIANLEGNIHKALKIDPKYKAVGIISDRIGAGPQIMAADEAVKATNTEVVLLELPRDTKGGAGHGCLILFGAEDVSDARRAVEVVLKDLDRTFGDVYANEAGHLEFQYTARASFACNKAFNAPLGKAFGLIVGAPAGIGTVMTDAALKAAEVEMLFYSTPCHGNTYTNECVMGLCGDSGAVRQSLIAAREVGLKLLGSMGSAPKNDTPSYI
jgi:microcompartment protein PduB